MWVFGYGSLMWDNWETNHSCLRRVVARLPGFRRTFNKPSVKNWGTRDKPCPTLNLAAEPLAICSGVAFDFSEEKRREVLDYLKQREGKDFELTQQEIQLENGDLVIALVAIYSGRNFLSGRSVAELVTMARAAEGNCGSCVDYVRNIAVKLSELKIDDPAVDEIARTL
jgi:cation transport protein ChaC